MVARRSGLERERRLGTFLVELSRWLLAAPDRELLLQYTLQSVTSLVEAQGAYVALRRPDGTALRVVATVGQCVELEGCEIALNASATGRRSEEHTSELQSHSDLVCRLLLEKKKKHKPNN